GGLAEERRGEIADESSGAQVIENVIHFHVEVDLVASSLTAASRRARGCAAGGGGRGRPGGSSRVAAERKRPAKPRIQVPHACALQVVVGYRGLARNGIGVEGTEFCEDHAGAREVGGEGWAIGDVGIAVL